MSLRLLPFVSLKTLNTVLLRAEAYAVDSIFTMIKNIKMIQQHSLSIGMNG